MWPRISGSLQRLAIWILVLAIWEGAYRATAFDAKTNPKGWRPWIFPAPSHIVDALLDLLNIETAFGDPLHHGWPMPPAHSPAIHQGIIHSALLEANGVSAIRLFGGFGISILLGGSLGIFMWRFKPLDEFFGPLFLGLQTLPSVCWQPMAILVFGLGENAIQFVLVMGSFFAIAIALRDGLRTIPPLYQRAGLMLGARGWRLYAYVLLPASLPALTSGLRQGFSFAWRSLMGAEFVFQFTEKHGLGYLLQGERDANSPAGVMGIMIMMVVIGMLADRLVFAQIEHLVSRRFGLERTK
jgi:NitT/TauT family transport system permease protein